jgi:hypothetical protein
MALCLAKNRNNFTFYLYACAKTNRSEEMQMQTLYVTIIEAADEMAVYTDPTKGASTSSHHLLLQILSNHSSGAKGEMTRSCRLFFGYI